MRAHRVLGGVLLLATMLIAGEAFVAMPEAQAEEVPPTFRRFRIGNRSGRRVRNLQVRVTRASVPPAPPVTRDLFASPVTLETGECEMLDDGKNGFSAEPNVVRVDVTWTWEFGGAIGDKAATATVGPTSGAFRLDEVVVMLYLSSFETRLESTTFAVYGWKGDDVPATNRPRFEVEGTLACPP